MRQFTKAHLNAGHQEMMSICRALVVAIALTLPANNLAAAAGRPPSKGDLSELSPEVLAALSKGRFTSRYFALGEARAAAEAIVQDPYNVTNTAARLSELSKYEALCGENVPTEVTKFRSDALAMQAFVQSRQEATYERTSIENAERKFGASGGLEVKAKANPLGAEANTEGGGGISYERSSQDKTEASEALRIPPMSSEDRAAYEKLLRQLDASKGQVDKAYREAETKQFEAQKAISELPEATKELFEKLNFTRQCDIVDTRAETGQPLNDLIVDAYARKYVNDVTKTGVDDFEEAARWVSVAAANGDVTAQLYLAHFFYEGKGVAQDHAKARTWIRKAAEQGNAQAQYSLAQLYSLGKGGPEDKVEALHWLRKSAEQGHSDAQVEIAAAYALGKLGLEENPTAAIEWLKRAFPSEYCYGFTAFGSQWVGQVAELGGTNEPAANTDELQEALRSNPGWFEQAPLRHARVRSYIWFALAVATGDLDEAPKARDESARHLSEEEISSAQAEVEKLLSKIK